ANSRWQTSII
nr:Chain C, iCAL36-Q peptide [synthetic construct]4K6Y_D Chain D, iCAL36-Q peptide [synthetic construct]